MFRFAYFCNICKLQPDNLLHYLFVWCISVSRWLLDCWLVRLQVCRHCIRECFMLCTAYSTYIQHHYQGEEESGGGQFHCAKFWAGGKLSSESLLVRQFLSESYGPKMQKFWLKTSILGKYRGRIEFLNISDLLCRKFAAVCWNSIESL